MGGPPNRAKITLRSPNKIDSDSTVRTAFVVHFFAHAQNAVTQGYCTPGSSLRCEISMSPRKDPHLGCFAQLAMSPAANTNGCDTDWSVSSMLMKPFSSVASAVSSAIQAEGLACEHRIPKVGKKEYREVIIVIRSHVLLSRCLKM